MFVDWHVLKRYAAEEKSTSFSCGQQNHPFLLNLRLAVTIVLLAVNCHVSCLVAVIFSVFLQQNTLQ